MMGNLAVREQQESDADKALIAERIEQWAWKDIVEAAPEWLRAATGLIAEERNGVLMLAAPRMDHLLFNRVIGLGSKAPATDSQIRALLNRYAALGIASYWIHSCPYARPPRLGRYLQMYGLQPYRRSWVKMLCPVAPLDEPQNAAIRVRKAQPADAAAIASIVGAGFDMPQRCAELFTSLIDRPHWQIFVAELDGRIVAAAGMFMRGDVAYLAFAATREQWRRRGAQQALIAARMHAAAQAGCRWVASETGFPVLANEISPSYHNMLRVGFRPVAIRDNYAPPGTQWRVASAED